MDWKRPCCGLGINLASPRINEMLSDIEKGLSLAPDLERKSVEVNSARSIGAFIAAYYQASAKHLSSFPILSTWTEHVQRSALMILALQKAHELDSSNVTIMQWIIYICTENLEGLQSGSTKLFMKDGFPVTTKRLELRDTYTQRIRAITPDYEPPALNRVSQSNCFIATATMGTSDHPLVLALQ